MHILKTIELGLLRLGAIVGRVTIGQVKPPALRTVCTVVICTTPMRR